MSDQDINDSAFKLIKNLDFKDKVLGTAKPSDFDNISGIPKIIHLDKVDNVDITITDAFGNIVAMFIPELDKEVGFTIAKFKTVKTLASEFLKNLDRSAYADIKFVEKEIFKWVINVYKTGTAPFNLITYLEQRLDEEIDEFTFHFKVYPLGIENSFEIGMTTISAFSNKYVENEYNKLSVSERPEWNKYKESFKYFNGSVIATINIKAVRSKAESNAMLEVALSLNALKCFLIKESLMPQYQIFDVDYKLNTGIISKFISKNSRNQSMFLNFKKIEGSIPIVLDKAKLAELHLSNFESFSYFLKNRQNNELYIHLLQAIDQYGNIISKRDLYERIVMLISFFEIFITPKSSNKSQAESHLKKNILPFVMNESETEQLKLKIRDIFNIRDKYIHNRLKIAVDIDSLLQVQLFGFYFLQIVMHLNKQYTTLHQLHLHFSIVTDTSKV